MKQSVLTGAYIHSKIKEINERYSRIGKAIDELDDGKGTHRLAIGILEEEYQRISDEMDKLTHREYIVTGDGTND